MGRVRQLCREAGLRWPDTLAVPLRALMEIVVCHWGESKRKESPRAIGVLADNCASAMTAGKQAAANSANANADLRGAVTMGP